jgi:hypothetical protein
MNLIKWELMKIFKQKSLYIIGLFLFSWFAFVLFSNTYETETTQKVYKEWEGKITAEKMAAAEKVNADLNEYFSKEQVSPDARKNAESAVVENIAQSQHIESTRNEMVVELDKRIVQAKEKGDRSLINELQLQINMYNEVEINKISYYRGPLEAVDFVNVFGLILSGLFLLIGLSGIYSNEHSSGVENYILSTKNGRKATMTAKLAAAAIFAVVVVVVWEVFNLITRTVVYGTKGWDMPIQYSFKYFFSPYSLTFMEYHMIQLGIHLVAAIAFAGVIVVVSTLSKTTVVSFFVSGFIFGVPVLAQSIMNSNEEWVRIALRYTLTNIMKVEGLFMNFISVNVFGYPIIAPYIGIALAAVVLVLSGIAALFLIEKKQIA